MNKMMAGAAALSAATFGLHVIGGGADVHAPIQASSLDLPLRAIAAVLWHFVSLALLLQAAGFGRLATRPNPDLAALLIALQLGTAALFLFYGTLMLQTVWLLPQWVIFVAIALLATAGLRRTPGRA